MLFIEVLEYLSPSLCSLNVLRKYLARYFMLHWARTSKPHNFPCETFCRYFSRLASKSISSLDTYIFLVSSFQLIIHLNEKLHLSNFYVNRKHIIYSVSADTTVTLQTRIRKVCQSPKPCRTIAKIHAINTNWESLPVRIVVIFSRCLTFVIAPNT